jgi:hypothetical protein
MKDVRLLYASTVSKDFDPAQLDNILHEARKRNGRQNITGLLFFTTQHFIQCIEGSRAAINALYNDMMRDSRHHNLILLSYREIDERMFHKWQMAYIAPGEISEEILNKHSAGPGFTPEQISEDMANAMLTLLLAHLER